MNNQFNENEAQSRLGAEKYANLKAEAQAPYRVLRKFIYFGFGASGLIGAFIFFLQMIAGKNISQNLPNLALQIGIVTLMIFLFRWDKNT